MAIDISKYTDKTLEELRAEQEKLGIGQKERFETKVSDNFSEQGKKYASELKKGDETPAFDKLLESVDVLVKRPQKALKQPCSYEAARVLFWRICKNKMALQGKDFVVDDDNREIIVNMIKYFINDPSSTYDLNKGMLLMGGVGTGKTMLFANFAVLAQVLDCKKFKIGVCQDIYDNLHQRAYEKQKTGVNLKRYFTGHWCFDDIGDEATEYMNYGNVVRPMDRILTERYKKWVNGWCITHGTSNLQADELRAKYGDRVYDRIREMFNPVMLAGGSRRG